MKLFWIKLGNILFWLSLPALHVYLRWSKRARIVIVAEDRVLVVKSWLGSGAWTLPGGGAKAGEPLRDAVIRELAEETGIVVKRKDLIDLGSQVFKDTGLKFDYRLFGVKLVKRPEPRAQQFEIISAIWLPLENTPYTTLASDVITGLDTFMHS